MKKVVFVFMFLGLLIAPACAVFAGEGHQAGWEWAYRNGITDPDDCRSRYPGRWKDDNINNSPSFTEGCLEYLRDEGITNEDDEIEDEDDDEDE
jgi:hypothetical protein